MSRERGRPRVATTDAAVLAATRELLAEVGYERLSYELVAQRAGVTRPTVYRRWPSKALLVYDAAFPADDIAPIGDSGDFRRDVLRLVEAAVRSYSRPETRAALPGLLPLFERGSELREHARDPLEAAARGQFRAVVEGAVTRGEAPASTDPDLLFDVLVGAVVFHLVFRGGDRPDLATAIVELVLGAR
ncbi:TetR/AcrR family transcriptional regulator [Dactylosporangium sucinum]|uniref:TetR family transcriptional regulator n=1 Tax=Dactylosporangium sucinum TaxID=1424081 RepID=A0A917X1M1_9ACTN|nr:TetR/AcrR family transcriptional regulator [Dactylosporangium sucinum]GGM58792.1 TetR family transcriptional regulator [Dactylosporangium sucinum]